MTRRTLTNLYNPRLTWLDLARRKLDAAVLEAYGWLNGLVDEEVRNGLVAETYSTHDKG